MPQPEVRRGGGAAAHPAEVGSWDRYPGTSRSPWAAASRERDLWGGAQVRAWREARGSRVRIPVGTAAWDGPASACARTATPLRGPGGHLQPDPVLRRGKPWISKEPTCRDAVRKEPPPPAASRAPETTPPRGARDQNAPPLSGRGCLKAKALAERVS